MWRRPEQEAKVSAAPVGPEERIPTVGRTAALAASRLFSRGRNSIGGGRGHRAGRLDWLIKRQRVSG
uniref:Uncharacterized protein n=1 Tax=Sphaerodactylus townsendi TaxID=933632 RepID=A0ACB8E7L1_9SAUR